MTCSKRFGRLLQASSLALIGSLAIAGCGGSETNNGNKDGSIDGVNDPSKSAVLNLDRSSVTLGTIAIGQSGTTTVLVTNTGKVASGAITVASSSPLVAATGCAAPLAPATSCTLTIVATPAQVGQVNATVSVGANPGAVTPLQISVSFAGDNNLLFRVNPTAIELGNVAVGVPAAKQTITVTAAAALTDLTITTSGADVSVDKAASTCTAALAANVPCTISVNFTATAPGPKTNAVVINAGGKTVTVPVTANALKPVGLVISPSGTQAFSTSIGVPSTAIAFGIANTGDIATGALAVGVTGPQAADFTVTNNCLVLAPLAGCTVSVVYNPKVVGKSAATLTVADSAGTATVSVILDGTAFDSSSLAITPAAGDVGSVLVGQTGAPVAFTVTNNGAAPSGAITTSVSNPEFVIANDTCAGASLAPKATCSISIALKPNSVGAKTATLTVDGTASDPAVKTLTGVGITAPKLIPTPAALDFPSVRVNTTGTAQVVTITNQGGSNTGVLSFTKSGQFSVFPITANTCSAALGPAATCTFTVNFAPTTEGSFNASYTVTDGVTSALVQVSGAALPPSGIGIAPKPLSFGEAVVGSTTATQSATVTALTLPSGLTNTGVLTVAVAGDAAADFKIVTDGCSTKSLLLDATCVLAVAFAPTAAGDRQATLTVTGANGGLDSVALKGKGLAIVQITKGPELGPIATAFAATGSTAAPLTAADLAFPQFPNLGAKDSAYSPDGYPAKAFTIIVRGPAALAAPFPTTTLTATLTNTASPADFNYVVVGPNGVTRPVANPCTGTILTPSSASAAPSGTNAGNWSYNVNEKGWTCSFIVEFFPQTGKGAKTAEIKATGSAGGEDKYTLTGESTGPLTLNALPLTFPQDIQLGQSSNDIDLTLTMDVRPNLTLTLKNNGQAAQGPFTMAVGGTDAADFRIVGETCSLVNYGATAAPLVGTLGQGQTCTVEVAFTPSTAGAKTGTVTLTAAGGEVATATFTANGTPTISATFAPAKVDFGTIVQTVTSEWKAITISNPAGAATTSQLNYEVRGDNATLFPIGSAGVAGSLGTCGVPGTTALAAGQFCTILVQFKPTEATEPGVTQDPEQAPNAFLWVDAGVGGTFEIPLSGTVGSMLTVTPAELSFGNVAQGGTSEKTLTVKNVGAAAATSLSFGNVDVFSVQPATTCLASGLAAGATCTIVVQMQALIDANHPVGQPIVVPLSDPAVPFEFPVSYQQASASAKLIGTPVNPARLVADGVAQTGNVIDLGGVRADSSKSGSAVLTFRNTGDVATTPVQFQWDSTTAGTADGQFLIGTEGGTCIGNAVQPKATCTVTVTFQPSAVAAVGPKALRIFANDGSSVSAFSVTATGLSTTSAVYIRTVTGANLGFTTLAAKTAVGATSTVDLQFTNGTTTALSGVTLGVTAGRHQEEFAVDLNAAGATTACAAAGATAFNLAIGQSCTFRVSFTPAAAYAAEDFVRWATIVPSATGAGNMTIMGTVLAPAALEVTPAPATVGGAVSFGEVALNSTKPMAFVVKNVGETATKTMTVTSSVAAYTVDAGCNVILAAGQSCTVNVTVHTAGTLGAIDGVITIADTVMVPTTFNVTTTGVLSSVISLPLGPLDFGTWTVGNTSDSMTITVSNLANGQTTGPVAVSLGTSTDFVIATNNCIDATTKAPSKLAAGGTCTVVVQFKPEQVPTGGVVNATLTATATPGGTATVGLKGTAQSTLYFAAGPGYGEIDVAVRPDAEGTTYWVVRRNTDADVTAMLKGAALSGTDAALFSVIDDGCYGSTLAGGEFCSVKVRTVPATVTAEKNAVLTVTDGTSANTATLKLQIAAP